MATCVIVYLSFVVLFSLVFWLNFLRTEDKFNKNALKAWITISLFGPILGALELLLILFQFVDDLREDLRK
jgi:glycopeptide antibiotics resistance protein